MDSDSGRAHSSDGHDDGEPLPRREGRAHLEPLLREPRGAGSGMPFAAFDPADGTASPDDEASGEAHRSADPPGEPGDSRTGRAGERVAAFRAAVRRATRRDRR